LYTEEDLEEILSYFVDGNGRCKICHRDHSFGRKFESTKNLFGRNGRTVTNKGKIRSCINPWQ